jgi:lambda family phage portal protein
LSRLGLQPLAKPRQRSAFAGAQSNRLTLDWILTPLASADKEQRGDLRTLRVRARELVRNTSIGAAYVDAVEQNVIGTGIQLQAKNYTSEGALHARANAAIEAAWKDWSRPGVCTLDGRHSLNEVLGLALRTWKTDGEWLAEIVEGPEARNGWGFALNLLDADLLDETLERPPLAGANEIRAGVEVDAYDRPVAYHLLQVHPSERGSLAAQRRARRVPAERIIHLFTSRRPHQTRGVTAFAPVMMSQRMLAGYMEAELVAARVASAKMGFIKVDPEIGDATDDAAPGAQQQTIDADPGSFFRGNPGESLEMFSPEHPTSAFQNFTTAIKQDIAGGLGLSYSTLTGDLSQANYGSMRVGMLAERDGWERMQEMLCVHVLDRLYRGWLRYALLNAKLDALNSFDASRWTRIEWQCRGFPWIDPAKDIDAAGQELALCLTTRSRLCAERGLDFEDVLEGQQREAELAKQYGVELQNPSLDQTPAAPDAPEAAAPDKKKSLTLRAG